MKKPIAKCKDCHNRKVGCHSTCEEYKKFLQENEEWKKMIGSEKEREMAVTGAVVDGRNRVRKAQRQMTYFKNITRSKG